MAVTVVLTPVLQKAENVDFIKRLCPFFKLIKLLSPLSYSIKNGTIRQNVTETRESRY